jgi:hypothetical protein
LKAWAFSFGFWGRDALNVESFPMFCQTLQLPIPVVTTVFAKTLEDFQHSMRLIPES